MSTKKTATTLAPLVVTTLHKGVFFGYGEKPTGDCPKSIRIERAQMCVSWATSIHGVLGLAATGPDNNCKIGPAVPSITLSDVTSVMEASDEAAAAWEKEGKRKW